MALTARERRFFVDNGYVGPFRLKRPIPRRRFRTGDPDGDTERNQHLTSRFVFDAATRPELLDRVASLLGPDLLLWVAHLMIRPAGSKGHRWHRDANNLRLKGVHASLAVTRMSRRNGCLHLIPGSHKYGESLAVSEALGLCDRSDSASMLRLIDALHPRRAPHRVVALELEPGQFFLMHGGTWHFVSPNKTPNTRVACVARYMRPSVRSRRYSYEDTPDARVLEPGGLPCVLVRGRDRHGLNPLHAPPERE